MNQPTSPTFSKKVITRFVFATEKIARRKIIMNSRVKLFLIFLFFASGLTVKPVNAQTNKTLVKTPTSAVYWFQNNKIYGIPKQAYIDTQKSAGLPGWSSAVNTFSSLNYSNGPIFVNPNDGSSNGLLLKQFGNYPAVYLIENNNKRVLSLDEFNQRGFSFNDVIDVAPGILNLFPDAPLPADLKLTSSLRILEFGPYQAGNTITAVFSIKNFGGQSASISYLTAGGRLNGQCPNNVCPDFTLANSVTIAAGATYDYRGTLTLQAGTYSFFVYYKLTNGQENTNVATISGVTNSISNIGVAAGNRPPIGLNIKAIRQDSNTEITSGAVVPEGIGVIFQAQVSDPDGDDSRLEIELRQKQEGLRGTATSETVSNYVSSGSTASTPVRVGLAPAHYIWQARIVDRRGLPTGWNAEAKYNFIVAGKPTISVFSAVSTTITEGSKATFNYTVSTRADVGLDRIELWRANNNNGSPNNWNEVKRISLSGKGPIQGMIDDTPSAGSYWYGIHVKDKDGAAADIFGVEPNPPGPIKVTVNSSNRPPTLANVKQYRQDTGAEIPEGGTIPQGVGVIFRAIVNDPERDNIRLEIELRQIKEGLRNEPTTETISPFVADGSVAPTPARNGLVPAKYLWQARAVDNKNNISSWYSGGSFIIRPKLIYVGILGGNQIENCSNLGSGSDFDPRSQYGDKYNGSDMNSIKSLAFNVGGQEAIGLRLSALYPESITKIFSPSRANDVVKFIRDSYQSGNIVCVSGHSDGAGDAQDVSVELNKQGIAIRLLGLIDSIEYCGIRDANIPPNVRQVRGFYQLESSFIVRGEDNFYAEDKTATLISNMKIDSPNGPASQQTPKDKYAAHRDIDNDERVWGDILNSISFGAGSPNNESYALTISPVPVNGGITGERISCGVNVGNTCNAVYEGGASVLLTAIPANGYRVGSWSGCQSISSNQCTVQLTQARTVSVTFTQTSYALTVSPSPVNGSVTGEGIKCGRGQNGAGDCSQSFGNGATVSLIATPSPGYRVGAWSGCQNVTGIICTVQMSQARVVSVAFVAPDIMVAPLSVSDFGITPPNMTSTSKTLTLKNNGTANLNIGTITFGGTNPGEFVKGTDNCSEKGLVPAQTCTILVGFRPASNGSKSATLVIPSNDPDQNLFIVPLSGTGGDTTLPNLVQVTAPDSGQTTSGTFTLKATAQDNSGTIQLIEFYVDSAPVPACSDTTPKVSGSTFQCNWHTISKSNGTHTIYARAYDPSNQSAPSPSVTFTINNVDTTLPTNVLVANPLSGQLVTGLMTLKGSGQHNSGTIQKIEFYLDADIAPICTDTTAKTSGSIFQCDVDTKVRSNGAHTVKARAYDSAGNFAESPTVSFTITNSVSYEADVSPRPTGKRNGTVSITDWVQIGRFVAGLDMPDTGSEFQRADNAPRTTFGDGRITVADLVQAGRYAAGLDPVAAAGGAFAPVTNAPISPAPGIAREVKAVSTQWQRGNINTLQIAMDAKGNENGLAFSLNYDPQAMMFLDASLADGAIGTTLQVNATKAANGSVGIVLVLPAGQQLVTGARNLVNVRFIPNGGDGSVNTVVSFSDQSVTRELVDGNATPIGNVTYTSAAVAITGKAVATVSAANYVGGEQAAESIVSAFGGQLAAMTQPATSLVADFAGRVAGHRQRQQRRRAICAAVLCFARTNQFSDSERHGRRHCDVDDTQRYGCEFHRAVGGGGSFSGVILGGLHRIRLCRRERVAGARGWIKNRK